MSEPLIEAHREQGMFMLFSIANIHNKFKSTKKAGANLPSAHAKTPPCKNTPVVMDEGEVKNNKVEGVN